MRRLAFYAIALTLALTSASAQSPTPKPDEASCRTFVQGFYDWYTAHGTVFERVLKLKQNVFSSDLKQALLADIEAQRKTHDDIVGLDFDPFVNGQDPAPHYRVGKVTMQEGACLAEIHSVPPTDKSSKPVATAELHQEAGAWKFANFHYGNENGPENENLISVLRQLKRDREKGK